MAQNLAAIRIYFYNGVYTESKEIILVIIGHRFGRLIFQSGFMHVLDMFNGKLGLMVLGHGLLLVSCHFSAERLPTSAPTSLAPSQLAPAAPAQIRAESSTDIDIRITLPTPSAAVSALEPSASMAPPALPSALSTQTPLPVVSTLHPRDLPRASQPSSPRLSPPKVASLFVHSPTKTMLQSGEILQLSATQLLSDDSPSPAFRWVSSNPKVASVDSQGRVNAQSEGSVEIQVVSELNAQLQDSLTLQVSNPLVIFPGKIVYLVDNDLYLMKGSNHAPERLTFDGDDTPKKFPRLSWDGSQVTYSSRQSIYTLQLEKPYQPVLYQLPFNYQQPMPYFMQDQSLLFSAQGVPGFSPYPNLWRAYSDGSKVITPVPGAGIGGVTPEGDAVIEYKGEVVLTPLDNFEQARYLGGGHDPKIAHNVQPKLIVYNYKEDLRLVTFAGQKSVVAGQPYYEGQGALSPDEQKIALITKRDGNPDLYLMNSDGSQLTRLTYTPELEESWPDWSN